jgi:hypothetical protein
MQNSFVMQLQELESFLQKTEERTKVANHGITIQDVVDDVRTRQVAMMKLVVCACTVQNFVLPIEAHTPTDEFVRELLQEQGVTGS